jgi:uroporphyrinogen-III synthase
LKEKKNNIISLYSTLSAKSFVKQIIENDLEALCKNKNFIVISEKVKEELKKLGKLSIFIAKSPKQKRMIDLIRKITLMEEKIG